VSPARAGLWIRPSDPLYNLALEEAVFHEEDARSTGPLLWLWINDPCVVVGVGTPVAEYVNLGFCAARDIRVARRMSGGGAVYQDRGNINWSLMAPLTWFGARAPSQLYARAGGFISALLGRLGLRVTFMPPNRLEASGRKVGGIAAYIKSDTALVHGTLLVNADLRSLMAAIRKHTSPVPVSNIGQGWRAPRLAKALFEILVQDGASRYMPSLTTRKRAWSLLNLRYGSAEWTFRL